MCFHQLPRDGEAEAGAVRPAGHERLEQRGAQAGRDAGSGVLHKKAHGRPAACAGRRWTGGCPTPGRSARRRAGPSPHPRPQASPAPPRPGQHGAPRMTTAASRCRSTPARDRGAGSWPALRSGAGRPGSRHRLCGPGRAPRCAAGQGAGRPGAAPTQPPPHPLDGTSRAAARRAKPTCPASARAAAARRASRPPRLPSPPGSWSRRSGLRWGRAAGRRAAARFGCCRPMCAQPRPWPRASRFSDQFRNKLETHKRAIPPPLVRCRPPPRPAARGRGTPPPGSRPAARHRLTAAPGRANP